MLGRNAPLEFQKQQQKLFSPQPWLHNNQQQSQRSNQDQLMRLKQIAGKWPGNQASNSQQGAMPVNYNNASNNQGFNQMSPDFRQQQHPSGHVSSETQMKKPLQLHQHLKNFEITENKEDDDLGAHKEGEEELVDLDDKDYFVKGKSLNNQALAEENKRFEFKNFRGPQFDERQKEQLLKTVCGFLNSDGGQIYVGVNDLGKIAGTNMNYKQYDNFKGDFVSALLDQFSPPVDDNLYVIRRVFVLDYPKQAISLDSWKNIVIEISIKSGDKVYFIKEKGRQLCYQRFDGSTRALQGDQINELFRKKMMDTMMKQQGPGQLYSQTQQ